MLCYKAEEAGNRVVKVNPSGTSLKRFFQFGRIVAHYNLTAYGDHGNRQLSGFLDHFVPGPLIRSHILL